MFSILSTLWAESETEQRPKCHIAMKNCQVESSQHTLRVPPFSGEPALSLQDLTWWRWDDWTHTLSHPFTPNFCSFTSFGKAEGQSEGTLAPISLFHCFQLATWIVSPKSPGHLCLQLPFALKVPGFKETVCRGETPQLETGDINMLDKNPVPHGEHPRDLNAFFYRFQAIESTCNSIPPEKISLIFRTISFGLRILRLSYFQCERFAWVPSDCSARTTCL